MCETTHCGQSGTTWHAGLPLYLQKEEETIQQRALTTIYGLAPYEENLWASGLVFLKDRSVKIVLDLLKEMCKPDHKLNHLIPKLRNVPPILSTSNRIPTRVFYSSKKANHVYFLLQVFWVILLFDINVVLMLPW